VTARDELNNTWDVSSESTFSVTLGAGGSWSGSTYTSENAGDWGVLAQYHGLRSPAVLHVLHGDTIGIPLSPKEWQVHTGGSAVYCLEKDVLGDEWGFAGMGKRLRADHRCTGCGLSEKVCCVGTITLIHVRPHFPLAVMRGIVYNHPKSVLDFHNTRAVRLRAFLKEQ